MIVDPSSGSYESQTVKALGFLIELILAFSCPREGDQDASRPILTAGLPDLFSNPDQTFFPSLSVSKERENKKG